MGSVVTRVSSICNVVEYDLGKYKELVERLGEASLDIESTLDTFPAGAPEHTNDRFNQDRRNRDIQHEDGQLRIIETLLTRFQDRTS